MLMYYGPAWDFLRQRQPSHDRMHSVEPEEYLQQIVYVKTKQVKKLWSRRVKTPRISNQRSSAVCVERRKLFVVCYHNVREQALRERLKVHIQLAEKKKHSRSSVALGSSIVEDVGKFYAANWLRQIKNRFFTYSNYNLERSSYLL